MRSAAVALLKLAVLMALLLAGRMAHAQSGADALLPPMRQPAGATANNPSALATALTSQVPQANIA